jgi:hypothetical protein
MYRLENNIESYPKEIRCRNVDWVQLAQYRDQLYAFVKMVINGEISGSHNSEYEDDKSSGMLHRVVR